MAAIGLRCKSRTIITGTFRSRGPAGSRRLVPTPVASVTDKPEICHGETRRFDDPLFDLCDDRPIGRRHD